MGKWDKKRQLQMEVTGTQRDQQQQYNVLMEAAKRIQEYDEPDGHKYSDYSHR